jgi:hypothetical protein
MAQTAGESLGLMPVQSGVPETWKLDVKRILFA